MVDEREHTQSRASRWLAGLHRSSGRAATVFVVSFGAETMMLYAWYVFIVAGSYSNLLKSLLVSGPMYALLPVPVVFLILLRFRMAEAGGIPERSMSRRIVLPLLAYVAFVTLFFVWPQLPGFREVMGQVRISPFVFSRMMRLKWIVLLFVWLWWCDRFRFRPDTVIICLFAFSIYWVFWKYYNNAGFVLQRNPGGFADAVMEIFNVGGQYRRFSGALRGKMFAVAVYAYVSLIAAIRRRIARYGRQPLRELWSSHFREWR